MQSQGCLAVESTLVRLENGEDGTKPPFDACYEACITGGYECCRMNNNGRCHGGFEDVEIYTEDNNNHFSTLMCLNNKGKRLSYSFPTQTQLFTKPKYNIDRANHDV